MTLRSSDLRSEVTWTAFAILTMFLENSAKYAHLEKEEEQKMTMREKKPHCPLGLDHLAAGAEAQSGRSLRPLNLNFTQQQNIKTFFSAPVELLEGGCSQLLERNIPTHS